MIYNLIFLFSGLFLGYFLLDIDHLIYWLITKRGLPESKQMQLLLKTAQYKRAYWQYRLEKTSHTSLIFHHFYFHLILLAVSIFIFTSNTNVLGQAILLSCNIHLFVHILKDFRSNPTILQTWFFARMAKQLPLSFLSIYLKFNFVLILLFTILLLTRI